MISQLGPLRAIVAGALFAISIAAQTSAPEIRNSAGVRLSIDSADSNPALLVTVPDTPKDDAGSKILMPEHVTVRAHGQNEQKHLYVFRPGSQGSPPAGRRPVPDLSMRKTSAGFISSPARL